jgi:hypothetical protein
MVSMPGYVSLYDTNPLPNPTDGPAGPSTPSTPVAPSKQLWVDWTTVQPLHTVAPPVPSPSTSGSSSSSGSGSGSSGSGSGGSGGSSDGGSGGGSGPPPFPDHATVSVMPAALLFSEQEIINGAISIAAIFNDLRNAAENTSSDPMWGMDEGANETQHLAPGSGSSTNPNAENAPTGTHYVYTDSALSTQQFMQSLVPDQRGALQYTANAMVVLGGFIQLLQNTADVYASADQYSVFPGKAELQKSSGS